MLICTIAYDPKLKRPGCVLIQSAIASISNDLLNKYFDVEDWLTAPTPDMGTFPIESEEQLRSLSFITKNRKELNVSYNVEDRVKATGTITENGNLPGDPNAAFPAGEYIHALAGDEGTVVYVDVDGEVDVPTVRFDRTGTATIVSDSEIRRV
jgi:hypothetical protein